MSMRMVRVVNAVIDPSGGSDRRDFYSSHYTFTRTPDGIAIHSKTQPDVVATLAYWANLSCSSHETAVEPEGQSEVNTVLGVSKQQHQGKRK